MSDKIDLKHKLGLVSSNPPSAQTGLPEMEDESEGRCYGYLRGVRERALVLEFRRQKEGDTVAFPYGWLGPSRYHPSLGILLVFSAGELFGVRIRGRNLNKESEKGISLFDRGIAKHRITYVSEMQEKESHTAGDQECVVERIEIIALSANGVMQFLQMV